MQVELAAGEFPFIECSTDFEVLSKVLTSDPPSLPSDKSFSSEFKDFVSNCLTKDYKQRPKYRKLLVCHALSQLDLTSYRHHPITLSPRVYSLKRQLSFHVALTCL